MSASDHLGPQFYDHTALGELKASDYAGHVKDGVEPMERWQEKFGGPSGYGNARQYDEGDGPTSSVERLRPDIRENGVRDPITLVDYGEHSSIKEGHHRAVAAYLEGKGAPVNKMTVDDWVRARYRGR